MVWQLSPIVHLGQAGMAYSREVGVSVLGLPCHSNEDRYYCHWDIAEPMGGCGK